MRWALLLAAACLICVSQPGQATPAALRLAKPNGTWSQYLNDVSACNRARPAPPSSDTMAHPSMYEAEVVARSQQYFGCMTAKGYRANPSGYDAGRYIQIGTTNILVPQWQ